MKKPALIKLVVTGGHHTPAFAFLDELQQQKVPHQVLWFGHKHSLRGDSSLSLEYEEVKARGYQFINLKAGKAFRIPDPREWFKLPLGFLQAFFLLLLDRPHFILSFGGYLAVPTVLSAWLWRIPIFLHEQTLTAGWANRFSARFARLIFVSWEESLNFFPPEKTVLVGNPLRQSLTQIDQSFSDQLTRGFDAEKKTLYITGGKQGAHVINEVIAECLPALLSRFNVIHQCGAATQFQDQVKLQSLREALREEEHKRYFLQPFFSEREIGAVFKVADLVVSRAGANVITELGALGKVALLIPLPHTPLDEQKKNAAFLAKVGLARVLNQEDLTPKSLLEALVALEASLEGRKEKDSSLAALFPQQSAAQMLQLIKNQLPEVFIGIISA